jgi:hypothetical protein
VVVIDRLRHYYLCRHLLELDGQFFKCLLRRLGSAMLSNLLRSVSINLSVVALLVLNGVPAHAQAPAVPTNNVSMSVYHVVRGGAGQQLFVTPDGQAVAMPGGGVEGTKSLSTREWRAALVCRQNRGACRFAAMAPVQSFRCRFRRLSLPAYPQSGYYPQSNFYGSQDTATASLSMASSLNTTSLISLDHKLRISKVHISRLRSTSSLMLRLLSSTSSTTSSGECDPSVSSSSGGSNGSAGSASSGGVAT